MVSEHGCVGVIGLGIMGGAIARNLARHGFRVIGHTDSCEFSWTSSNPGGTGFHPSVGALRAAP